MQCFLNHTVHEEGAGNNRKQEGAKRHVWWEGQDRFLELPPVVPRASCSERMGV